MRARKRFGQNFLTDRHVISQITRSVNAQPSDTVVEIGPGHGALTNELVRSGSQLTAIEIDRDLILELRVRYPALTLIEMDVLKVNFNELLPGARLRIVGNLPYNISTPLLFKLFQHGHRIVDMHFMLQLEVVERMIALPSTKNYGRLSIMTQYYCEPEMLFEVPSTSFTPAPKVTSAIVRLIPKHRELAPPEMTVMETIVSQAFSQRRKTIRNALKGWLAPAELESLSLDPRLRPENLSLADFIACANFISTRDGRN